MTLLRISSLALTLLAAGCGGVSEDVGAPARDLAADTASLPKTDIFTAALSFDDGAPKLEGLHAAVKNPGYDNQPSFLPGEPTFYYVSEGESGKTDIWRHGIESDASLRLFHSPDVSEYSPKPAPGDFGVSYIQENEAADVTRVHHMPTWGGPGAPVADFAPLGYYAWLEDGAMLAVFLRSEPPSLHLVDVATGEAYEIAQGIGRTLQASPDDRELYFTLLSDEGGTRIMRFDVEDESITEIATLPDGVEDFAAVFSDDGALNGFFAGKETTLYFRSESGDWTSVGDYAEQGLSNITRIAVSGDNRWIAIVAESN